MNSPRIASIHRDPRDGNALMAQHLSHDIDCSPGAGVVDTVRSSGEHLATLGELLVEFEIAAGTTTRLPPVVDPQTDQLLVERRLGTAAGLFVALRSKHASTAIHDLHVALLCSAWARQVGLNVEERETIEVASLLHDLWVIGVPDRILHKPTALDAEEINVIAHARRIGWEILRASGAADCLLSIVENVPVWFDGSNQAGAPVGREISRAARMIAIAEAFDSMTTDHVFRPGRSKEQSLGELVRCSGTQFDPNLIEEFATLARRDTSHLYRQLASQWLQDLESRSASALWHRDGESTESTRSNVAAYFQAKILDNTRDCVVLVDPAMNVIGWNRRTEQLTGIVAESIIERPWMPEAVEMRDPEGRLVSQRRCPLRRAVASCMQSVDRYTLSQRGKGRVTVEVQTIPVLDQKSNLIGAAMLMRDVSSERSLEELCQNLYTRATRDPLTRLANRTEFERVYADLVDDYRKKGSPFSLIICDLDHFKQVNDAYGHQAGDEVLVKTSTVLQDNAAPGDLVARYGGEEFVLVCPDCGIAAATRRAEMIRDQLSQIEHLALGGGRATASFGVTQVQPGDTTETILRRADRALYLAKNQGRNQVIQLGVGTDRETPVRSWAFWGRRVPCRPEVLVVQDMVAPGPLTFVLDKLRGFVADHQAVVKKTQEDTLELVLTAPDYVARRKTDLGRVFLMTMRFTEATASPARPAGMPAGEPLLIQLHVGVASEKLPRQTNGEMLEQARQIVTSLRAYLMAKKVASLGRDTDGDQGRSILLPVWVTE
jgi:diguanylate cyclase (GGDEF)-like protein/PAS domain S-box-containing protein